MSPVLRTLIETYVEFTNLARDPDYLRIIDLLDGRQKLAIYKAARDGWSRLAEDPSIQDIELEIERIECARLVAKAEGVVVPDIKERFGRADLGGLYAAYYGALCSDVHSNRGALESRHLTLSEDRLDITIHGEPDADILDLQLFLAVWALRESSLIIYDILDNALPEDLKALIEEVDRMPVPSFGRA